jgi:nucleotidyltransferase substrate binding protein (TIGR01987 family)
MPADPLILTTLVNAVTSLREALAQPVNPFIRDATIKRLEFTYELFWKFMRRYLRQQAVTPEPLTRRDLFRDAAASGLINDPQSWFKFHDARNLTAHTYNEETAKQVYEVARLFLPAAEELLARLESAQ